MRQHIFTKIIIELQSDKDDFVNFVNQTLHHS